MRRLLVVAAMAEEAAALHASLGSHPATRATVGGPFAIAVTTYAVGDLAVSIVRSGIGSVNAAVTVALVAEAAVPDAVLLLGVGGALAPNLRIGELVVSRSVLQHDYVFSLDFATPRVRPGHLVFTADEAAAHVARFDAHPRLVAALRTADSHVHVGTILSGNEFVGTVERKRALATLEEDALLVEMEAAGVAQVADRLGVPFVVAKTVADRLHADGTIESDFRASLHAAAAHAATCLARAMTAMASS